MIIFDAIAFHVKNCCNISPIIFINFISEYPIALR